MPKLNESPVDQNKSPLETTIYAVYPSIVCGVSRKVNTGNFENVDIFSAISIPVIAEGITKDPEILAAAAQAAAELGFAIVSSETGERYQMIKELQKGGRPAK